MVAINDLKTGLGSRFCITDFEKTFDPKTCPGSSSIRNTFSGDSYALIARMACNLAVLPLMTGLLLDSNDGDRSAAAAATPVWFDTLWMPHDRGISAK
jgi:hypothetical protein